MNIKGDNFIIFGNNPEQALRALMNTKKPEHSSTQKLGLIIEGGGMRGIIAGGMVIALHKGGFTQTFANVYGSSAGALGGAYFLAGQSPYGVSIYYEEINNHKFINTFKVPISFNIDYLMNVVKNKKKLDVRSVLENPSKLIIAATDIKSGQPEYFSDFNKIDLFEAIRASCALPMYYDKPVTINGKQYLDGGILTPLPIRKAIEDGCTDIIVLMTSSKKRSSFANIPFWFQLMHLRKYGKNFIKAYYKRHESYSKSLDTIENGYAKKRRVNIAAIAPNNHQIHNATLDAQKLKNAYHKSYVFMDNLLEWFRG